MKITWPDGLEAIPSYIGIGLARQVPTDLPHFATTTWVTEDGLPFKRHRNPVTGEVTWKHMRLTMHEDTGQFGITTPGFHSEVNLLAIAWRHRAPNGRGRAFLVDPSGGLDADNVRWKEEEDPEVEESADETWSDLEWEHGVQPGYKISNRGRLYSTYSHLTTRGFFYKGHRYAGIMGGMLVNLTVASGNAPDLPSLPDHLIYALNAFAQGISPAVHARTRGIREATAWGYYHKVASYVDGDAARAFVDANVWEAVARLPPAVLFGPLSEVRVAVEAALGRQVDTNELVLTRLVFANTPR